MTTETSTGPMPNTLSVRLRIRVRYILGGYIVVLLACGITVFPLPAEIRFLDRIIGVGTGMEQVWPAMAQWISSVHRAVTATNAEYSLIFYGTDWLAFAHIMIAIAFIGPWRDPVRNVWVVEFGMIACLLVIPLALICGPVRGIPLFWQLIDCSFGLLGIVPLWYVRTQIRRMADIDSRT